MKSQKFISYLVTIAVMLSVFACQQPSEKNSKESETVSELPVTTSSDEALSEYQQGLMYIDLGDNVKARKNLNNAIELDPSFAMAYVYRSWTSRSPAEFADDVKKANELNKNLSEAEQLMIELDNSYLTSDRNLTLKTAKTIAEKYPDAARSHYILGDAYNGHKDFANARKCFEKSIELNPDWIGGHSSLGNSYIFDEPKDLTKAEEHIQKCVELMPNESRTHIALGDVYRAQQDLNKALTSYNKAAELAPDDPQAHSKAGHANTFLGNFDKARSNFQKSKSLNVYPDWDLNFEAFTHLYEGNHAKGMAWLKEQVMTLEDMGLEGGRLNSAKVNNLSKCKWMALHLGDANELKTLLEMIEPLDKANAESTGANEALLEHNSRMNRWNGIVAALEGNFELATEKAEACRSDLAEINDPRKLEDYNFLKGFINMKQENYNDAVTHFEKSDLNDIYPKYMLAMANQKAGNGEKATALLKEIATYNFNEIGYALVRKEVMELLASPV